MQPDQLKLSEDRLGTRQHIPSRSGWYTTRSVASSASCERDAPNASSVDRLGWSSWTSEPGGEKGGGLGLCVAVAPETTVKIRA